MAEHGQACNEHCSRCVRASGLAFSLTSAGSSLTTVHRGSLMMADKPQRAPDRQRTGRRCARTRVPTVLVAGGPDELVEAAQRVAAAESPRSWSRRAARCRSRPRRRRLRPFALVVNQDVFAFDPEEFSALARDVQAELIVLKVSGSGAASWIRRCARRCALRFGASAPRHESGPVQAPSSGCAGGGACRRQPRSPAAIDFSPWLGGRITNMPWPSRTMRRRSGLLGSAALIARCGFVRVLDLVVADLA